MPRAKSSSRSGYNPPHELNRSSTMPNRRSFLRRLKLRTVLVVALLLSGIIPLAISSALLIYQSNMVLGNTERDNLTGEAKSLSLEVNSYLSDIRRQLSQLGTGILLAPGPDEVAARLQEGWVGQQLQSFQRGNPDVLAIRVLDLEGAGLSPGHLAPEVQTAMDATFEAARTQKGAVYRVVGLGPSREPRVVLAIPIGVRGSAGPQLILEALFRFLPLEKISQEVVRQGVGVFLIDRHGKILWSGDGGMKTTALDPETLNAFIALPMTLTSTTRVRTPEGVREIFAQVSDIREPTSTG
jgi:hypothetical protein